MKPARRPILIGIICFLMISLIWCSFAPYYLYVYRTNLNFRLVTAVGDESVSEVQQSIHAGGNVNTGVYDYPLTHYTWLWTFPSSSLSNYMPPLDYLILSGKRGTPVNSDAMKIIGILLSHGADINRVDWAGDTPLIAAVKCRRVVVVKLILSYHPKLSLKDAKGRTALQIAEALHYSSIAELLKQQIRQWHG